MASHDEFTAAVNCAARRLRNIPAAIAVHYDKHSKRIAVRLNTGLDIAFDPHDIQGLEDASPDQFDEIEISPSGLGIHFPKLDADIYVPALLEGFSARAAGWPPGSAPQGGKAATPAKTAAARINGRLGGRPRKAQIG